MKKEELIQKLEATDTPDIVMEEHQRQLRETLLTDVKQNNHNIFVRIFYTLEDKLMTVLYSRQPVWKTGLAGCVLAGIILTVSLLLPVPNSDSVYARAVDIVKNTQAIQELMATGDNQTIHIYTKEAGQLGYLTCPYVISFTVGDIDTPESLPEGAYDITITDGAKNKYLQDGEIHVIMEKDGENWTITIVCDDERP